MNEVRVSPNPISQHATIFYSLDQGQPVTFAIYDLLGREVFRTMDEIETAGAHTLNFDASHLQQGTYLYKLTAGGAVNQGKIVIVR